MLVVRARLPDMSRFVTQRIFESGWMVDQFDTAVLVPTVGLRERASLGSLLWQL